MASAPPGIEWIKQLPVLNTAQNDSPFAFLRDSSDSLYVLYTSSGTVSGGTNMGGSSDLVVAKLDSAGNLMWIKQRPEFNSANTDISYAAAIDGGNQNLLVCWASSGSASGGTFVGGYDVAVMKLDSNGDIVWIKQTLEMNTTGFDSAPQIAADSAGNAYVCYVTGAAASGGVPVGNDDIVLLKLDSNGSLVWLRQQTPVNTLGPDRAPVVTVDVLGNPILVYYTSTTVSGGTWLGNQDFVVAKFDAASGGLTWIRQNQFMNTSGLDTSDASVATDSTGGIYVSYVTGGTVSGGTNAGGRDIVVFKLDADGSSVWAIQNPTFNTSVWENGTRITTDFLDNVYVSYTTTSVVSGGENSGAVAMSVLMKLASDGTIVWIKQDSGLTTASGNGFAVLRVSSSGAIYGAYSTSGTVSSQISQGSSDIVVFKLSEGQVFVSTPPRNVVATAGNTTAAVTWSAPSYPSTPILYYEVTASPGGATVLTPDGSTTSTQFTGLANDTTYTFTVVAWNAQGASSGAVSNSVIPREPGVSKTVLRAQKTCVLVAQNRVVLTL